MNADVPPLELCWGTVRGASVDELLTAAADAGFATVTVTPHMVREHVVDDRARRRLAALVASTGVGVRVIDPLITALPGTPGPADVQEDYASFFGYDTADAFAAAEAVGASVVNLAHFLGVPTRHAELVDAVGAVCAQATTRGLTVALEFLPGTGVPDLESAEAIRRDVGSEALGLTLDTWHLSRSGGTADEVAALPRGAVSVVQLCDRTEPPAGEQYTIMADRLLPGAGKLDLAGVLRAARLDPALPIGVEVFSAQLATLPAVGAARAAADAMRRVLGNMPAV